MGKEACFTCMRQSKNNDSTRGHLVYHKNEAKKSVWTWVRRQLERALCMNRYYFYNLKNESIFSKKELRNESPGMRIMVTAPNFPCDHGIGPLL